METKIDLEMLTKPFGPESLEQRKGAGNKMFTYVATHAVISRLNRACAFCWDFHVLRHEWVGDVLMCYGELTIPGLGTRGGYGVQKYTAGSGEDLLKGASSDALKKAATQFGVGLELYGEDREAPDYTPPARAARPAQQPFHGYSRDDHQPYEAGPPPPRLPAPRQTAPRPAAPAANQSDGAQFGPCYKCKQRVRIAMENGKQERYNSDGSHHFRTCGNESTGYEVAADIDPFAEGN